MIRETVRKPVATSTNELIQPARCSSGCEHSDAITCIARQHNMSRFNAMLTFSPSDIDRFPGSCSCPCHRDAQRHQVDEQTWLARVRRQSVARTSGNRNGHLNLGKRAQKRGAA